MNSQLESIADARRARELARIASERGRVDRARTMGVIGSTGQQRPASQTAEFDKITAELDTRANYIRALSGDALVSEFVPEVQR